VPQPAQPPRPQLRHQVEQRLARLLPHDLAEVLVLRAEQPR
jgi:hypothetical protein